MTDRSKETISAEQVSRLIDGDLEPAELAAVLDGMGNDQSHECWHVYQLIGEVLRDPLCGAGDPAQPFWQAVRTGIDGSPRLVAAQADAEAPPEPWAQPAANDSRFRWKMAAGLASFAAVAVLGWNLLDSGLLPQESAPAVVAVNEPQPGSEPTPMLVLSSSGAPDEAAESIAVLRDPELDHLLAAHRQASEGQALGGMNSFLRTATFEGSMR